MNADPMAVQKIFAQAVAIADPNLRQAYIREQCTHDAELLHRVEALLAAYDEPKAYFDQPTAQLANPPASAPSEASQRPGSLVAGRYKLLEQIGEGGMGTVWVAEQSQPVKRKVALKLVKAGMDSKSVLARFEAERQALAVMDHPNIAKVLDGGLTETGRPYFVMDYVKGVPITEYCDAVRLSVPERLQLFVQVCHAVQHAHQKGIIHRDLKPSNILVAPYDDKPVPKVIDFGLAKAINQSLTEKTLHTAHDMVLGTPLYMSPEQAQLNNIDVDTRSDIYSLGVLLYELLTGSTPVEKQRFKQAAWDEMRRIIREEEPQRPSLRLSSAQTLPTLAAGRHAEPTQLTKLVRGELDWIAMKALEKDRTRRYETANGFATDVLRHLSGEPVQAAPPSPQYRLRKFAQKHRAALTTTVTIGLLLVAGASISTWQAVRAIQAESLASSRLIDVQAEQRKTQEALTASQASEQKAIAAQEVATSAGQAEAAARAAESEQRTLAEQQRDEAQRLQQEAVARSTQLQQLTEEQRRAIYASDMNLVRIEAQRGNLQRMREILYAQLPFDHSDLRGFEWYYWYRYLNQAQVVRHFDIPRGDENAPKPVVLPSGKLVAVPKGSETTVVNLQSGELLATFPQPIGKGSTRARFAANGRAVFGEYDSQKAFGSPFGPARGFAPWQGELLPSGFTVYEPGKEAREFQYPTEAFSHISFLNISADGRFVGVLGNDKKHQHAEPISRLLVWNVDTQEVVLDHAQPRRLNRFVFNRDGSRVAAYYCHGPLSKSNEPRDVVVGIDVIEKTALAVAQHDDDIESAIWLPDNNRLLLTTLGHSGRLQRELLSWDILSNKLQRLSSEIVPNSVLAKLSPDGELFAVSGYGASSIRLIDATTGSLQRMLHNEASAIESFDFNGDGSHLIACCDSGDVVQWSTSMSNADRYALRSQPLPGSRDPDFLSEWFVKFLHHEIDWDFSGNHDLLAYRSTPGQLLSVRTSTGKELFVRDGSSEDYPLADRRIFFVPGELRFNSDGKILALVNSFCVALIDLGTAEVRWSIPFEGSSLNSLAMEFSSDQSTLIVGSDLGVIGFDVETGTKREIVRSTAQAPYIVSEVRKCGDDGHLLVAGMAGTQADRGTVGSIDVRNAMTGERLYSIPFDVSSLNGFTPAIPIRISPSGKRLVRVFNESVELWDLPSGRLVFKTNGSDASFSHDSQRLVISCAGSSTPRPVSSGATVVWNPAVERVRIVSAEDGRLLTELFLAGDEADEVRISPDGRRLLTLHGKFLNGAVSRPAHARLWDCKSGREILDLAIVSDRVYHWDLNFDPSGNLLTGGVLSKASGEAGEDGYSLWWDATPLSPEEDAQLIASKWVDQLSQQTPVPQQMIDAIQRNTICAPRVRQVALEMVGHISFDPQLVVNRCLEIIELPGSDTLQYQRALSWARVLEHAEQGSLRTIALVGAAQFRLGQIAEALATLRQRESMQFGSDHQDFRWEQLRRSIEILCLHRQVEDTLEAHRRAISLADYTHEGHNNQSQATLLTWPAMTQEALRTQGGRFLVSQLRNRTRLVLKSGTLSATPDVASMKQADGHEKMFSRMDLDQDGNLTATELLRKEWLLFDKDGIEGLSLAEFSTALTISSIRGIARSKIEGKNRSAISKEFSIFDKDRDGRATADEWGPKSWTFFETFDKNRDEALDLEEFQQYKYQKEFVGVLMPRLTGTNAPTDVIKLLIINAALEDHPNQTTLLNARAWIFSTSSDDKSLNGQQAVRDATQVCEALNYVSPGGVDTLAAAYAETRDFNRAIEFAEKAIAMVGPGKEFREYQARLELYRQQKPYRQPASDGTGVSDSTSFSEQPLLSADHIAKARRIPGGDPCWSADGERLIYALTGFGAEHSFLESLDLRTGEQKVLCRGGQRPICSPVDETLAFIRPVVAAPTEIWLYDPVSNQEKKLTNGFRTHWTNDGKLCYNPVGKSELICIKPDQPDQPLWRRPGASSPYLSALSPDGKRYGRSSHGKWALFDLEATAELPNVAYNAADVGRADWSPDGRFVAYGAQFDNRHGVWLIDTHTQETRLLAELAAYPRWSPDGKTLALGLQSSNEIVLLDVSSLDSLWNDKPEAQHNQP